MSSHESKEKTNVLLERLEQNLQFRERSLDRLLETNNVSVAYQSSGYAEVLEELCGIRALEMGLSEPLTKKERRVVLHSVFDDLGVKQAGSVVTRAKWAARDLRETMEELRQQRLRRRKSERFARRRARLSGVRVGVVSRARVIARDKSTCYLCNRVCSEHEIHLDHVVPLSKGGPHSEDNLRVTCPPCNIRKSDSLPSGDVAML